MRKVLGLALLCMALGMLIVLIVPFSTLFSVILFLVCLIIGYLLFCKY